MSAFKHLFGILAYGLFAVAIALLLPSVVPALEMPLAALVGMGVFLFGAVLHEHLARQARDEELAADVRVLQSVIDRLSEESGLLREEARTVRQGLAEATEGVDAREQHLEKVVSEVRVLQSLITQLSDAQVTAHGLGERRVAGGGARILKGPGAKPAETPRAESGRGDVGRVDVARLDMGRQETGRQEMGRTDFGRPDVLRPDMLRTDVVRTGLNDAQILDIVREGLKRDRVDLFLQPIVSLPQRKPRFYECFSRIRAEDGSMILPEQYIEVARRDGSLSAIDNMLLFRCIQLVRKAQRHKHNLGFFCNISVHTLVDRAFFREFIEFMADNRELASQLTFEFAQEDIASHWKDVSQDLYALARLGFYFSMDRVQRLDLDPQELAKRHFKFIKVDAANLLAAGEKDMRQLKRDLDRSGIDMIVSKIENESELVELLDHNIDFGQGYLFGEPRLSKGDNN
ncbi:MAG TPA: EAL domain-containing protein [Alphaproteobacteria bacterium]|jgi:cyclic-di-GMP phosphodiesterase TipF (flagellum assembly factor)